MTKKLTKEEFIARANIAHDNKYDYSEFVYTNIKDKGTIICPIHGKFEQRIEDHLKHGCPACGGVKVKTKEEFIKEANIIHDNKYDYSKFEYINTHTKGIIICPLHGESLQTPNQHLKSYGCSKCGRLNIAKFKRMTRENFIIKSNIIHNNKYDYSEFIFIDLNTKGIIICPKHGKFEQLPRAHLQKSECAKCGHEKHAKTQRKTLEQFIIEANIVHNNRYKYNNFIYKNGHTVGIITCKLHGEFLQSPAAHLTGADCPKCASTLKTLEQFIIEANIVHNNRYDYSKFIYINYNTKGIIICTKHGEFLQTPSTHLKGTNCSKCSAIERANTLEKFIIEANLIHNNRYDYSKFIYINYNTKGIIICQHHGEFKQTPGNHLQPNDCPKCSHQISRPETLWLNQLNILNENRQKVIFINKKRYNLDAFDEKTNTIYEFYGDYWHGNPEKFDSNKMNKSVKKTFGELYQNTIQREQILKEAGYTLITIWENDFKKQNL